MLYKKLFLFFFIFILLSTSVLAISISPPSVTTDFKPGETETFSFDIGNIIPSKVKMEVGGFLSQYITVSETEFTLEKGEHKQVTVTIKYPSYESLSAYGRQRIYVKAIEQPLNAVGISAVAAVAGAIFVKVPIPGEYAEIVDFSILSVEKGQNTHINLVLENQGTEPLNNKNAKVILYSPTGEKQDTITFSNINIPTGEQVELSRELVSNDFIEGKYFADAEFTFSNEMNSAKKNTTFFIGSADIILDSYTETLTRGKINKIDLTFQSIWGSPLKDVRTELTVQGETEKLPVLDFGPFGKTTINGHPDVSVDAEDFITGELKIQVPVAGKIKEKIVELNFQVVDAGEIIIPDTETGTNYTLLIAGVVLLILILVGLNIYLLTKNKKDSKKGKK